MTTEQLDFSINRIIDELYLNLMKVEGNYYEEQARYLMYRIPIYRPVPFFDIKISHLYNQVKNELDNWWNYKYEIDKILIGAVSKIFVNINEDYFLLSVKRLLQVRLVQ